MGPGCQLRANEQTRVDGVLGTLEMGEGARRGIEDGSRNENLVEPLETLTVPLWRWL